jgi:hypothetical protein
MATQNENLVRVLDALSARRASHRLMSPAC